MCTQKAVCYHSSQKSSWRKRTKKFSIYKSQFFPAVLKQKNVKSLAQFYNDVAFVCEGDKFKYVAVQFVVNVLKCLKSRDFYHNAHHAVTTTGKNHPFYFMFSFLRSKRYEKSWKVEKNFITNEWIEKNWNDDDQQGNIFYEQKKRWKMEVY